MTKRSLLDDYNIELSVRYKSEQYLVRDNGAVLRKQKENSRKRPLDEKWTFGKKNNKKGYMYIGSETVHRIIAYAFLGHPPSNQHIVDHIDTNRCNNRPENLRWVTKLENIILNPITLKKISIAYGSLENFFLNPSSGHNLSVNIAWMRTVSKEEALNCKKNLLNWANMPIKIKGNKLEEWIYQNRKPKTENSFSLQEKQTNTLGYPT